MENDELWSCRQLLTHVESQLLEISTAPSQVLRNAIAADLFFVIINFDWTKSNEIRDRILAIVATLSNCGSLVPVIVSILRNIEGTTNSKDKTNFQHFLQLLVEPYPEELSASLNETLQSGAHTDFLLNVTLDVLKLDEYVATPASLGKLLTTLTLLLKRKSFVTDTILVIGEIVTLILPKTLEKSLFLLHSLFQLLSLLLEEHIRQEKRSKQDVSASFHSHSNIWSRLLHMLIVLSPWNTVLFLRDLMCDDKAFAPYITTEVQKIRMPSNMLVSDDAVTKAVVQMTSEEFENQLNALRISTVAQRPASPAKLRPVAIVPPLPPCNLWEKFESVDSPSRTPPPFPVPTFDSRDADTLSQYSPRVDSPHSRASLSPTYARTKQHTIHSDDAYALAALSMTSESRSSPTSPTVTRQPTFERPYLSFANRMDSNATDDSSVIQSSDSARRLQSSDLAEYLNQLRSEHQGFAPFSIVPQTDTEKELMKEVLEDRRRLIEILDSNATKFANRLNEMRMELKKSRQSTFVKLSKYMELCEDLKRKNDHLKQEVQEVETLYTRNQHNSEKAVSYSYMQHLSKERYIVSLQERIKDCELKILDMEKTEMAKAVNDVPSDSVPSREIVTLQSMIATRNSLIYSLLSRLSSSMEQSTDTPREAHEVDAPDTTTSASSLSATWKYAASPEEESFLSNFTDTSLEHSLQHAIRVFSRRGSSIDLTPRHRPSDMSLVSVDSSKIHQLEGALKEMQAEFHRTVTMKESHIHTLENRVKQLQKVLLETEDKVVVLQTHLGKMQSHIWQRNQSDEGRPPTIAQYADSPSPDYEQYVRHLDNAELMKINKSTITGRREGDSDMYHTYMTREMDQRKELRRNKKHDNCQPS